MKVKKDFSRFMYHHHLTVSKTNSKCSSILFPLTTKYHCSLLTTTQIFLASPFAVPLSYLYLHLFIHSLHRYLQSIYYMLVTIYKHEQKLRGKSQLSGCFIIIVGEGGGNTETSG